MIILGAIAILIGFILFAIVFIDSDYDLPITGTAYFGGLIVAFGIWCINSIKSPKAIDVYRGKTTLQITYKNNVPVDTIVVYK